MNHRAKPGRRARTRHPPEGDRRGAANVSGGTCTSGRKRSDVQLRHDFCEQPRVCILPARTRATHMLLDLLQSVSSR